MARVKAENMWQPIETAPRDGTPILAYAFDPVAGVFCDVTFVDRFGNWPETVDGWARWEFDIRPQSWVPIPAFPAFPRDDERTDD